MSSQDKGNSLILSVNAGSSSLKISVFARNLKYSSSSSADAEPITLLLNASVDNLTALPARFSFAANEPNISKKHLKKMDVEEIRDHESAFSYFIRFLAEHTYFHEGNVTHVCHRVVHGGSYTGPVIISNESYHHIESLSDLAPLHNGRALTVIEACLKILPDADSVAFFDSMFHATLPECVVKYAIDQSVANSKGLRKYGFHGLSYSYILRSVSTYLKKPTDNTTIIVMHLGSGASVCAIKDGKSIDTSMGLTPLDGLPGATRSGHVDASLIFHYTNQASRISRQAAEAVEITDAEEILNKNSGWNALAGTSDFSVIAERANTPGHPKETLAFDLLVDRILGYVGSYFLKLGGAASVDALVFSGGLGENSVQLRKVITDRCKCIGFDINDEENEKVNDKEGIVVGIGEGRDGMKALVCRTDEQLEMARQCVLRVRDFDI